MLMTSSSEPSSGSSLRHASCEPRRGTCASSATLIRSRSMSRWPRPLPAMVVDFQHLANVHARGHAQRVQDDVDRRAVGHVRHVFRGRDLGIRPCCAKWRPAILSPGCRRRLTAVTYDHLEHARGAARRHCVSFLRFHSNAGSKRGASAPCVLHGFELRTASSAGRMSNQWNFSAPARYSLVDGRALGEHCRPHWPSCPPAASRYGRTRRPRRCAAGRSGQAEALVVVDDLLRACRAGCSRVKTCVDPACRTSPGPRAAKIVLHVRRPSRRDGAQQLLFRRERGLALGRDADQRVAGLHFSAHVDDAGSSGG